MQDEEVTFNVFEAMKYPSNNDECYQIDIVDKVTIEKFEKENPTLPLEACIIHSNFIIEAKFERGKCANYLEATTLVSNYLKHTIEELVTSSSSFILSI